MCANKHAVAVRVVAPAFSWNPAAATARIAEPKRLVEQRKTMVTTGGVLLTVMLWSAAVDARPPAAVVNTQHRKQLQMIRFALLYDREWRLVLEQRVRATDDAVGPLPYRGEEALDADSPLRDGGGLLADGQTEIAPVPLFQTVLRDYWWLGSYVAYAARVLHTALMCVTFQVVSLQMYLIVMLEHKYMVDKKASNVVEGRTRLTPEVFHDAWSTLTVFMDKLAAVHGTLDAMADVSYTYSEALIKNRPGLVRDTNALRERIDDTVGRHCVRIERRELYNRLGVSATPENEPLMDAMDMVPVDQLVVRETFDHITELVLHLYDRLGVRTMDMGNWQQILDFKTPILSDVNPYIKTGKPRRADRLSPSPKGRERVEQEASFEIPVEIEPSGDQAA